MKAGETYVVRVPPPEPAEPEPQAIPLAVVYEDAHLIVIDKPKGLTVHPAPGHASGTLVNALIAHCGASLSGIGGVMRPGIVHRLDKDTTGLLVAAKIRSRASRACPSSSPPTAATAVSSAAIARSPGARRIARAASIDAALARSAANRTKIAVVAEARGRHAVTRYEVLETFRGDAPQAGRQPPAPGARDRPHAPGARAPRPHRPSAARRQDLRRRLQGQRAQPEPRAQAALEALGRQALHAAELAFVHPVTGKRLAFTSPLPPDMADLVAALKGG